MDRTKRDRFGRKLNLPIYNNISTTFTTVNFEDLKSVALEYNSHFIPCDLEIDYMKLVKKIEKRIRQYIYFMDNQYFRKECIVNVNIKESGLSYTSTSYFGMEIFFYVKEYFDFKDPQILLMMNNISKKILDDFIIDDNIFKFYEKRIKR